MINKKIAVPPALLILAAVIAGFIDPAGFEASASAVLDFSLGYFGWFYTLGTALLLAFCIWVAFSRYGCYKFGGAAALPEMSIFNWWAISICAGIAIGIVFFGVAEPMAHYTAPAPFLELDSRSVPAAESALRYAFLHWTFHTYGIYVSVAICIAYPYYKHGKPLKVSTGLYPLVGERIHSSFGIFVDGLSIFAIIGGVATSLGFGTLQIGGGVEYMWQISPDPVLWFTTIAILTIAFTISSYTGLKYGIRILSAYNIRIYLFLMLFVLVFGPTIPILEMTISAVGDYVANLISMSLYLDPMGNGDWLGSWSVFYWAWWLAFAPVVGLFLVRLAYGRTIRQFIVVNLIGAALFGIVWFGVFGGAAIYLEHFANARIAELIETYGNEVSMYALFGELPFTELTGILVTLAIAISFITLADSMTSTIANITANESKEQTVIETTRSTSEAPAGMKIFWGVIMGMLSWVLLASGGASALQASVILCGLPILVVILIMIVGFVSAIRLDKQI